MLPDELRVALAGDDSKPHGQFPHEIEDRDQRDLQRQQSIASLRAALRGVDEAAGVTIGEHDDDAGAGDEQKAPPVPSGRDGPNGGGFARRHGPA